MSARNPNFYDLLLHIDRDLAERTRAQRCRCGGVLHSARYPRKPPGLPGEARSCCDFRYSFCCADCRHRTTPFSVRFFGRRVYVAAIMVVVSATRASAGNDGRASSGEARCGTGGAPAVAGTDAGVATARSPFSPRTA